MFICWILQHWKQYCFIELKQFDFDNKIIKNLIAIFNNNTKWNSVCNIIKQTLQLYY